MPKSSNAVFEKHLRQPSHQGALKNPSHVAEHKAIENGSETKTQVFAQVEKQEVRFIQFVTDASKEATACLSFLCTQLEGKPASEIENWTAQELIDELGLPKKNAVSGQIAFDAVWKVLHGTDPMEEAFAAVRKYNEEYPVGGQYKTED